MNDGQPGAGRHVFEKVMLHPAIQILLWIWLALILQWVGAGALIGLGGLLLLAALLLASVKLGLLVRRTRWIMLSLFLIYAWTTPGAPLFEAYPGMGPSMEGIIDGAVQLGRLFCALAALAVLLSRLDTSALISGLYWLCRPLDFVGLARDRLAVRLALTLHYAESALFGGGSGWRDNLEQMLALPQVQAVDCIELHHSPVAVRDWAALAAALLLLPVVWL